MAWSAQDFMSRIGRTPEQQKYFNASGKVNSQYSSVASQQNPNPIYSYTPVTHLRGGQKSYGKTVNVYNKDRPGAAAPAAAGSAAAPPVRPPTPTTPTNNYQSQIAALTASIAQQQQSAAAAAAASQKAAAERAAAAKASEAQYQSRLSDLSKSFDSRLLQQQQGFDTSLAQQTEAQAAYLNDLQIQQDTRLSKMALDAKTRADDLALGQRTYQQNQSRSNQLADLQIGNAGGAPKIGGTQGFKRRKLQVNPVTANALSGILGGSSATSSTNTLNV